MKFRFAVAQLQSSANLEANLARMREFVRVAKSAECGAIVFPELAYFTGQPEVCAGMVSRFEEIRAIFGSWAKEFGLYLFPGTIREPGAADQKWYNTQLVFNPEGEVIGQYRKIHLFKATLTDKEYDESKQYGGGSAPATIEMPFGKLGLSICYDVRFPELFQIYRDQSAKVILIPSAFTVPTGTAHWDILVRARAIETQTFVLAPGQVGISGDGSEKYGHSLVVGPWGEIVSDLGKREACQVVELDFDEIEKARSKVDIVAGRREDVFRKGTL